MGFSPIGNQNTLSQFITSGLTVNLDANNAGSYSGSGTSWGNLQGLENANLVNGPIFNGSTYPKFFTFDGTNDVAQLTTAVYGGTNTSFTYSGWIYFTGTTTYKCLIARGQDGFGSGWSVFLGVTDTTSKVDFTIITTSPSTVSGGIVSNTTLAINTWYHITGVWTAGVSMKIYINGILDNTLARTVTNLRTSTRGFNIGMSNNSFFAQRIGSVNVYNRVLSDDEILQNFNASKSIYGINTYAGNILYYDAGNVASYPGTGTAWSNLAIQYPITSTLTNGPTFSTNNGGTIVFDGTNDFTTTPANTAFNFGTADFAIEAWIKINGNSNLSNDGLRDATICSCYPTSGGVASSWHFSINGTSTTTGTGLVCNFINSAGAGQSPNLPFSFTQGVFYQVGITRIGGATFYFINGQRYTTTNVTNDIQSSTRAFKIGTLGYAGYLLYLNGTVGIVRIYKGKGLNAAEVLQNYREFSNRI